nr:uncharacterized protein LOC113819067 [Penaeus vannamei]
MKGTLYIAVLLALVPVQGALSSCATAGGVCVKAGTCSTSVLNGTCSVGEVCCSSRADLCLVTTQQCEKNNGRCDRKCNRLNEKEVPNLCSGSGCFCCTKEKKCKQTGKCKNKNGKCYFQCTSNEQSFRSLCKGGCVCCVERCEPSKACEALGGRCAETCDSAERGVSGLCVGNACKCCVLLPTTTSTTETSTSTSSPSTPRAARPLSPPPLPRPPPPVLLRPRRGRGARGPSPSAPSATASVERDARRTRERSKAAGICAHAACQRVLASQQQRSAKIWAGHASCPANRSSTSAIWLTSVCVPDVPVVLKDDRAKDECQASSCEAVGESQAGGGGADQCKRIGEGAGQAVRKFCSGKDCTCCIPKDKCGWNTPKCSMYNGRCDSSCKSDETSIPGVCGSDNCKCCVPGGKTSCTTSDLCEMIGGRCEDRCPRYMSSIKELCSSNKCSCCVYVTEK